MDILAGAPPRRRYEIWRQTDEIAENLIDTIGQERMKYGMEHIGRDLGTERRDAEAKALMREEMRRDYYSYEDFRRMSPDRRAKLIEGNPIVIARGDNAKRGEAAGYAAKIPGGAEKSPAKIEIMKLDSQLTMVDVPEHAVRELSVDPILDEEFSTKAQGKRVEGALAGCRDPDKRGKILMLIGRRPVIAESRNEAEAWKLRGKSFLDDEKHRRKVRRQAAETVKSARKGVWTVDIPRAEIDRFLRVAEATDKTLKNERKGMDSFGDSLVSIHEDGRITLSREDAPLIELEGGPDMPRDIKYGDDKRYYPLVSRVTVAALRGARNGMDPGDDALTAVFAGTLLRGVVPKFRIEREEQRQKMIRGIAPDLSPTLE